jgi:hypothetical protein
VGWLRELMAVAEPPIDGYGELARRALAHPEWPADTQPQARSLAALFSKLDRGIELEWLADRDSAQQALARVLGCPIESVRREVEPDPDAPTHRLRFDDLPYARPFDLAEEPLPPGIPEALSTPAGWERLWWQAASGSGRSLAGQWLAARGLARFVRVRDASDRTLEELGRPGPLYVEIELEDRAALEAVASALPARGVCVAAPGPAPTRAGASRSVEWELLTAPPLAEVLPRLMRWLEDRLPRDGSFDAAAAEAWLAGPLADGLLPTLGALLGAAGLLDARGVREARGKHLVELAEAMVNERLERASVSGSPEAQWLKRFGFSALVKLAESALVSSDRPWSVARSRDDWIALVPPELGRNVDAEWVRWSAARAGDDGSLQSVQRALREVPPGAYRIVRALLDARLLTERAPGLASISPEFLKHAALRCARDALVGEGSPSSWGEALLRPHAAPEVLTALQLRIAADDFSAVEQLAELDVGSRPALVIAAEALFVCLGLRALSGADVPLEHLQALHAEQLELLVELPGELPQPRLLCFDAAASSSAGASGSALAEHSVWLLATLAASEALGERAQRAHALLGPWRDNLSEPALAPLLDRIFTALAAPGLAEQPWGVEAFALAGRLLDRGHDDGADAPDVDLDAAPAAAAPHPLARPTRLAEALLEGALPGEWLQGFGEHPLELRALEAACALRGIAWSRMAHALWKSWQARGCPHDDRLLSPAGRDRERLWPYLPPEVMAAGWARWTGAASTLPFACFGPSQWTAFVELFAMRWRLARESPIWAAAFEAMELESLQRAVLRGHLIAGPDEPGVRPLLAQAWRRFPTWLAAQLCERASSADAPALTRLLETAPDELGDELVRVLSTELVKRTTQRPVIDAARAWSLRKVASRRGDFHAAYALFMDLESRLQRAQRARGL